ncbi:MAG: DUF1801 domain-containing protein [Bacteroidales bacterium]|nr:DUF1801 domain-containing protein [Bacteroidales bacterium]
MNPKVDKYMVDGCMRCKHSGTPLCKVNKWREELETLRQIALESGLTEELKWGVPVYTHKGKNLVLLAAFKEYASISFFKGVLLKDEQKILSQRGSTQSDRYIKFTNTKEINAVENILKNYIKEAITIEDSGKKITFMKNLEPIPQELIQAFEADLQLEKAFNNLTPGRQRAYIIHFSEAKQSSTRVGRIEKYKQQILNGLGINEQYSMC